MSTRATYATKMNDKNCLIEALKDLCGPSHVTIHGDGIEICYDGINATFHRNNKTDIYDVTIGERRSELSGIIIPTEVNGQTIYKLGQVYSKAMIFKAMKAIRGTVVRDEVNEDGIAQIQIRTFNSNE